jgi:streptomycin 6-kinase
MESFPDYFHRSVCRVFGDVGKNWLAQLPEILTDLATRWKLDLGPPVEDLGVNYLAFAHGESGEELMLKVGVPHRGLVTEMEVLRIYNGRGIVKYIDGDPELGALLLKRIRPGTKLHELGDNREESRLAAGVMRNLQVPVPAVHSLPTYAEQVERRFRQARLICDADGAPFSAEWIDTATHLFRDIQATKAKDVVLHGDLHHENILFDEENGWLAIDPKGIVGDPCLEVGRFLHCGLPDAISLDEKRRLLDQRIEIFSQELGQSEERIRVCGTIDIVSCLCSQLDEVHPEVSWRNHLLLVAQLLVG